MSNSAIDRYARRFTVEQRRQFAAERRERERAEQRARVVKLAQPIPLGDRGVAFITGRMSDAPASVIEALQRYVAEDHARVRTHTVVATRCEEDGCPNLCVTEYCNEHHVHRDGGPNGAGREGRPAGE